MSQSFILRSIIVLPILMVLALIGASGFQVLEPIYTMTSQGEHLGNLDTVMLFAALGFIALPLVAIIWWWVAPLRSDVRQDVRRI